LPYTFAELLHTDTAAPFGIPVYYQPCDNESVAGNEYSRVRRCGTDQGYIACCRAYPGRSRGIRSLRAWRRRVALKGSSVQRAPWFHIYAAANKVLAGVKASDLQLKAFKYYYIPIGELGLSGIVAEPTPELLKLQQDLVDAVGPFTVPTGTAGGFVTTPKKPDIQAATIDYIAGFVPEHTGANYSPHVTTGLAPKGYLDKMLAQPFAEFTFSPAGASVYQLAEYGTAAKKLKDLDLQQ